MVGQKWIKAPLRRLNFAYFVVKNDVFIQFSLRSTSIILEIGHFRCSYFLLFYLEKKANFSDLQSGILRFNFFRFRQEMEKKALSTTFQCKLCEFTTHYSYFGRKPPFCKEIM